MIMFQECSRNLDLHSDGYENIHLLGYDAVCSGENHLVTFTEIYGVISQKMDLFILQIAS
jgi:hypothetical protein